MLGILLMAFSSLTSAQQVLFEAYSRITIQGQFVGFSIQRYEYERVKRQFTSTYYVQYNETFGNTTETLKALATDGLEPLSYTYHLTSGAESKAIDAKVFQGKMRAQVKEKGKTTISEIPLPKGSFFSTFLSYVICKNPMGLKVNNQYPFQAVAEETASLLEGKATVLGFENYKGVSVYRIQTDFPIIGGEPQDSYLHFMTSKGEPLVTRTPQKQREIELVDSLKEAAGTMKVPFGALQKLFGSMPSGGVHPLTDKKSSASTAIIVETAPNQPSTGLGAPKEKKERIKSLKPLEQQKTIPELGPKQGAQTPKGIQTKSK